MTLTVAETLKFPFQCKLCGEKLLTKPKTCPACGCPNIRNVQATGGKYDVVSKDQVAHFKKVVEDCWNRTSDSEGNELSHKLVEKLVPTVDVELKEYHDELHCATCGRFYANYNGRAATVEELLNAVADPPQI